MKDYFPPAGLRKYYFRMLLKIILILVIIFFIVVFIIYFPEIKDFFIRNGDKIKNILLGKNG